jgi:hypothetical protein
MALSGGAGVAGKYVNEGLQGRLYYLGRSGGIVSVAALGLGEVFLISRYATGDVSSPEFWKTHWILGTTRAGSLIGGFAGMLLRIPVYSPFLGSAGGTWGESNWTANCRLLLRLQVSQTGTGLRQVCLCPLRHQVAQW